MPIGSIYGMNEEDNLSDPIWLVPRRVLYPLDDRFQRNRDFQIFVVENNTVREVSPNRADVIVEMTSNYMLSTEETRVIDSAYEQFFTVGRHIVTVKYNGRSANYSLEVWSPNNGGGIGGGGGIDIIWVD